MNVTEEAIDSARSNFLICGSENAPAKGLVGLLLVSTRPIYAEDSAGFGKWLDVLPDGKIWPATSCVGELLAQSTFDTLSARESLVAITSEEAD